MVRVLEPVGAESARRRLGLRRSQPALREAYLREEQLYLEISHVIRLDLGFSLDGDGLI